MSSSTVQFQLDPKIPGADFHISYDVPPTVDGAGNVNGDFNEGTTNKEGYGMVLMVEGPRKVWILVRNIKGYEDDLFDVDMPHDALITRKLTPKKPLAIAGADGWDIRLADGSRYIHNQATNYLLAQKAFRGEDISPFLYEGFDGYHFTLLMDTVPKQVGLPAFTPKDDPNFYNKLGDLLTNLTNKGKRAEVTLVCDNNIFGYDEGWLKQHADRSYDVIRAFPSTLCQLANEWEKNGINVMNFQQPAGVFWSRGSSLAGGQCPLPPGNYSTAHLSRNEGGDHLDAQPFYMCRGYTGYAGTNGPVITNETRGASDTENSGRRTTNPLYFRRIASAMRGWSGGTFHADFGIHSDLCTPGSQQDACRLGWLEGIGA